MWMVAAPTHAQVLAVTQPEFEVSSVRGNCSVRAGYDGLQFSRGSLTVAEKKCHNPDQFGLKYLDDYETTKAITGNLFTAFSWSERICDRISGATPNRHFN